MAAYSSAAILELQAGAISAKTSPRCLVCLNCCCRLVPSGLLILSSWFLRLDPLVPEPLLQEHLLQEQLAANLTRTLTFGGDRSTIHPADELNFDIREQHKDSDA